jgi:anaphase-promoting complex subunit 1
VFVTETFWPESVWLNIHYSTELLCCKYDGRTISAVPTIPCIAATPILCTRHDIYDALILEEGGKLQIMTSGGSFIPVQIPTQPNAAHEDMARQMAASLSMQIDGAPPVGPAGSTRQVVGVSYPAGTRATLIFNDGESVRASFDFRIKHRLVRQCCEALTQVLPVESYYMVKRELLVRLRSVKDGHSILAWHAFIDSIKTGLRFPLAAVSTSANKFDSLLSSTQQSSNPILRRLAAKVAATRPDADSESRLPDVKQPQDFDYSMAEGILFGLHMVAQDSRCTAERQSDLLLLAPLLSELSGSLAATNWWDYWQRLVPSCSGILRSSSTHSIVSRADALAPLPTSTLDSLDTPPDILHHLTLCLTRKTKPFPIPRSNELGDFGRVRPFNTLEILCDIYANLSDGSAGIAIFKAHETINKVIRHGLTPQWIQSLSFGVAMPIMEALRMCQHHPSKSWTPDVYAFVGRPDYASKTGKVADGETPQATVSRIAHLCNQS